MEDGNGVQQLVPAFKETTFSKHRSQSVCAIINGIKDTTGDRLMVAFPGLSNSQIANVLNYITKMKQYKVPFYNELEIIESRNDCK